MIKWSPTIAVAESTDFWYVGLFLWNPLLPCHPDHLWTWWVLSRLAWIPSILLAGNSCARVACRFLIIISYLCLILCSDFSPSESTFSGMFFSFICSLSVNISPCIPIRFSISCPSWSLFSFSWDRIVIFSIRVVCSKVSSLMLFLISSIADKNCIEMLSQEGDWALGKAIVVITTSFVCVSYVYSLYNWYL